MKKCLKRASIHATRTQRTNKVLEFPGVNNEWRYSGGSTAIKMCLSKRSGTVRKTWFDSDSALKRGHLKISSTTTKLPTWQAKVCAGQVNPAIVEKRWFLTWINLQFSTLFWEGRIRVWQRSEFVGGCRMFSPSNIALLLSAKRVGHFRARNVICMLPTWNCPRISRRRQRRRRWCLYWIRRYCPAE